jgi:D-3-phosphoglycerate dehydrogenase
MKKTVLFSAPYMIPSLERFRPVLERHGIEILLAPVQERLDEQQLLQFAGQFDGAICGDDRYSATVLEACAPRLKVISKWGTGIDSIDQAACARLNIRIGRTPNAFTLPVADTVFGYMLSFARRLPSMDKAIKAGEWNKIPGRSLSECTLGIVGLGNIGKTVARRGRVFGMHLLGVDILDIAAAQPEFILETGLQFTSLESLLQCSDFVSLHCDLNPTSLHLINHRTISLMKSNAILINTARGPVVEEAALVWALGEEKIAGAALDVYEREPLTADSPLITNDRIRERLLLAPHNANSSPAAWERVHWNTIRNLLEGLGIEPDLPGANAPANMEK